eukprot:SAG25_NODE_13405_length_267_cov_0.928571_1_plen_56_part_01
MGPWEFGKKMVAGADPLGPSFGGTFLAHPEVARTSVCLRLRPVLSTTVLAHLVTPP